ncbi:hypothetical protein [Robinsoniella peoriensis]
MGNTNTELADSCKGADLRRGRRFDAGTGEIETGQVILSGILV